MYISHCMLFEQYCKDEGGVQAAMDKLIAARNRARKPNNSAMSNASIVSGVTNSTSKKPQTLLDSGTTYKSTVQKSMK